ncbi:MAG: cytochrome b [Blastochloris viridis]|uniref:Cytochrome b n=1 Tax=Blastochloris viridis TaxID=1079 RepID=A0A6N4QYU5_BLAVI|nr:MAG: cytochrome b [Blastochloris viridis]
MKTTAERYNAIDKALHWAMALVIVGMLISGLVMGDVQPLALKFQVIQLHKSFGILVLVLAFTRVFWRFTNPAPRLPLGTPLWQKAAAHGTHLALYGLMFVMPFSGWLMSDAKGYHPNFFGLPVPVLGEVDRAAGRVLGDIHEYGAYLLMALIAMHVGAALFHHFIVKDEILTRMLPARCGKSGGDCCCKH